MSEIKITDGFQSIGFKNGLNVSVAKNLNFLDDGNSCSFR